MPIYQLKTVTIKHGATHWSQLVHSLCSTKVPYPLNLVDPCLGVPDINVGKICGDISASGPNFHRRDLMAWQLLRRKEWRICTLDMQKKSGGLRP